MQRLRPSVVSRLASCSEALGLATPVPSEGRGRDGVIQRAMMPNMRSRSRGLVMWSFMPHWSTRSRSAAMALAVMAMTGSSFQSAWARMRSVAV